MTHKSWKLITCDKNCLWTDFSNICINFCTAYLIIMKNAKPAAFVLTKKSPALNKVPPLEEIPRMVSKTSLTALASGPCPSISYVWYTNRIIVIQTFNSMYVVFPFANNQNLPFSQNLKLILLLAGIIKTLIINICFQATTYWYYTCIVISKWKFWLDEDQLNGGQFSSGKYTWVIGFSLA